MSRAIASCPLCKKQTHQTFTKMVYVTVGRNYKGRRVRIYECNLCHIRNMRRKGGLREIMDYI